MTEKREKMLRVRFNESEWLELESKSMDANLSMSEYVRKSISKSIIKNRADEKKRIVLASRFNANLNMICKWANTYKSKAECIQVIECLLAIESGIKRVLEK